jgi:glycosyltransferase involved in cell wall biosynthesis
MRVALLNPCFFPEVRRGSERIIRELANELVERGHRPRLITSHPGRPDRREEDGLDVVRNWRPPDGRLTRRGFQEYTTHLPFSYASLARGSDELAHAFYYTDATAALRWRERTGRPVIFSYMGLPDRAVLADKREKLRFLVPAVERSDVVITLSRAAAAGMERWLGVESRVIFPGVDLDTFTPGGERAPEPTIVCAAAPDDARKRVDLLVRAFNRVRRERPDARLLVMCPRDPETVARCGLDSPGVELFEPVDDPAGLAPLYRSAWVSALTSYREAFGVVVVESLACGTPVVAGDDAAVPEILDRPGLGALFGPPDEEEVARALLEALDLSRDEGTAAACRDRAADFSTERAADAHVRLYEELLGG